MKNRIISFFLACILIIIPFVSGCSPKDDSDQSDKSANKAEREKVTNVFKTNWLSLPEGYSISFSSSASIALSNDRIYILGYESTEIFAEDDDSTAQHTVLVSCNMDGNEVQIDEMPYEGVNKFDILSDGSIVFLLCFYDDEWKSEYWLNRVDTSGNEVFSVNITDMISQLPGSDIYNMGSIYINYMAVDAEDRIYLQSSSAIAAVSPDTGKILFDVTADAVNQMLRVGDKVAVQYRDGEAVFKYIDPDTKKMGESVFVPDNLNIENYIVYPAYGGNDSGILYCYKTAVGLCSVSENGTGENEVVNWLNSDISQNHSGTIMILSNDKVFYTGYDLLASEITTALLTRVPEDEVVPKYVIEIAYVNRMSGTIYDPAFDIATKFNRDNENYRVVFTDYRQLANGMFGEELELFINTQIAAGNIPDLFLLDPYILTGKNYENKGLFYDLYEYMDSDSELNRDKFLKCVLPAGEFDGKLYKLIPSFEVSTVVGKTENIGDMRGWSISDFLNMAENQADGVRMLLKETQSNVFSILENGLGEFIDSETGTCSFNSDLFLHLLSYLGSLPKTISYQINDEDWQKDYMENTALLKTAVFSDFLRYKRQYIDFNTDNLTFVGFPGGGEKIEFTSAYAMSAKSEKEIRDGAWAFIKYVFASEYRFNPFLGDAFPSTYDAFQQCGEYEYMRDFYYLIRPNGTSGSIDEYTQEQIAQRNGVLTQITQEDVEEVLAYLESIEKMPTVDTKALEIINEEMEYFFSDAKTAEETANLIQSRVSIYLSESN